MDFRMDKESWVSIVLMIATMMFFIIAGAGGAINTSGYFWAFLFALLTTIVLISICCIPVLIYCYLVKKIPDIDYSINLAAAATFIGIISEII